MGQPMRSSVASLSRTMAALSTLGFVLMPVVVAYVFIDPAHSEWLMFRMEHIGIGGSLTRMTPLPFRLGALFFALPPVACSMWALWSLRRLFLLYAQGSVFSKEAIAALNHVAVALFAGVVVGFAAQAPISLLLSWPRGATHCEISLGFGSTDVANLFMAGVVLVIARVMAEAQRMADENANFV